MSVDPAKRGLGAKGFLAAAPATEAPLMAANTTNPRRRRNGRNPSDGRQADESGEGFVATGVTFIKSSRDAWVDAGPAGFLITYDPETGDYVMTLVGWRGRRPADDSRAIICAVLQ